jgi:hypothetical protein
MVRGQRPINYYSISNWEWIIKFKNNEYSKIMAG